ncbi:hypothetical protein V8C86DRAFT_2825587 [Haematococcus lacustris]
MARRSGCASCRASTIQNATEGGRFRGSLPQVLVHIPEAFQTGSRIGWAVWRRLRLRRWCPCQLLCRGAPLRRGRPRSQLVQRGLWCGVRQETQRPREGSVSIDGVRWPCPRVFPPLRLPGRQPNDVRCVRTEDSYIRGSRKQQWLCCCGGEAQTGRRPRPVARPRAFCTSAPQPSDGIQVAPGHERQAGRGPQPLQQRAGQLRHQPPQPSRAIQCSSYHSCSLPLPLPLIALPLMPLPLMGLLLRCLGIEQSQAAE